MSYVDLCLCFGGVFVSDMCSVLCLCYVQCFCLWTVQIGDTLLALLVAGASRPRGSLREPPLPGAYAFKTMEQSARGPKAKLASAILNMPTRHRSPPCLGPLPASEGRAKGSSMLLVLQINLCNHCITTDVDKHISQYSNHF